MPHEDTSDLGNPRRAGAERKQLPANKVRQGRRGRRVLMVLVAALILAAIAWWAAEIYGRATEPAKPIENAPQPNTQQNQTQ